MQTESRPNDIGMPLEQGQPRGHGGGRNQPGYMKAWRVAHPYRGVCENCGNPFSNPTPRKHCSKECRLEAFKEKQAHRAKPRKCKTCGVLFKASKAWTSHSFCSDACRPKQPESCAWCNGPMPEQRGLLVDKYCCTDCKRDALRDRNTKKARERKKQREKDKRTKIATALRMLRSGKTREEIANHFSMQSCVQLLLGSRIYARISAKRRKESKYAAKELRNRRRSVIGKSEKDFNRIVHAAIERCGMQVQSEVAADKHTGRRVDMLVTVGMIRYAIEAKHTNRTCCVDECIGQALVKAHSMKANPVCVFPSDLPVDKVAYNAGTHLKVLIANEKTICGVLRSGLSDVEVVKTNTAEQPHREDVAACARYCKQNGKLPPSDLLAIGFTPRAVSICTGTKLGKCKSSPNPSGEGREV